MIPETTIEKIKDLSKIEDFVTGAKKAYGQNKVVIKCPACGYIDEKKKQGLIIDTTKDMAKCFKCGQGYGGAIDFVMKTENLTYPDALRYIAKEKGIFIEETVDQPKAKKRNQKAPAGPVSQSPEATDSTGSQADTAISDQSAEGSKHLKSFCDSQLEGSGLVYDDVRVTVRENDGTERQVTPFCRGTRDQYGNIVEHRGDDMLIKYYDLEGRPV